MVTDEADAVLSILARKAPGQPVSDADWQRLFSSEGYVRLKKRDTQMGRPFEDADFRTFVLSGDLAKRAPDLTRTLGLWSGVDPAAAARRALAYLPEGARIRAKIYPVIKPKDNSFVFEVKTDPAIFLYLDPAVPPEKLENTLAHELHHIGFGGSCPSPAVEAEVAKLPAATRTALLWMGGFGEGIAMLAAAGGPDVHPHAVSPAADRERWDRDVARFPEDLRRIEVFFRDVLAGKLSEEEAQKTAMTFYGEQGPWYTVGWKMAATIETALGRDRLVAAACDPRRLLSAYNEAARKLGGGLPLWSEEVVKLGDDKPAPGFDLAPVEDLGHHLVAPEVCAMRQG
ncbi:MAG: DUF5700 domain-containing putative Zn-dependent protease [Thermoanaerobaculia bacterium]